jgi:hypothetical protein
VYIYIRVFYWKEASMALRDLVAKTSVLTEQAIEDVVTDYVRYDPDERVIHLTPAAARLQNRGKVLIYLVALQGWPFISKDQIPVDAKPAELEECLGIQGGTLRPILKELKDSHIVTELRGRYSIRTATLANIKAELGKIEGSAPRARLKKKRKNTAAPDETSVPITKSTKSHQQTHPKKKSGDKATQFGKWIDEGFFDAPKTLAEVQKRFHKEGMIVPRTSVPGYLLKAIRSGRLTREEADVNGKRVWVYRRER